MEKETITDEEFFTILNISPSREQYAIMLRVLEKNIRFDDDEQDMIVRCCILHYCLISHAKEFIKFLIKDERIKQIVKKLEERINTNLYMFPLESDSDGSNKEIVLFLYDTGADINLRISKHEDARCGGCFLHYIVYNFVKFSNSCAYFYLNFFIDRGIDLYMLNDKHESLDEFMQKNDIIDDYFEFDWDCDDFVTRRDNIKLLLFNALQRKKILFGIMLESEHFLNKKQRIN